MKCNNCGAPIQMNQKFCPNCGSPNVEFKKHIDDMEQYNKKFNSTRSKVIGNSKWFVNYIAPITALVITMTALTLAIIGKNSMIGYDIARKNQQLFYMQWQMYSSPAYLYQYLCLFLCYILSFQEALHNYSL